MDKYTLMADGVTQFRHLSKREIGPCITVVITNWANKNFNNVNVGERVISVMKGDEMDRACIYPDDACIPEFTIIREKRR